MASTPRVFFANVPVLITSRTALRARLYDRPEVPLQFRCFAADAAEAHDVRLFHWVLLGNHSHMLVSQDFTGLDRRGRRGISWFMQDLFAPFHKWLNGFLSLQGHARERPFRSVLRWQPAEVLSAFLYITLNPVWHGAVERPEAYSASGTRVYLDGVPDGVITHVPGLLRKLVVGPAERGELLRRLVQSHDQGVRDKERHTAHAAKLLAEGNDWLDPASAREAIPIAEWSGAEAGLARQALRLVPILRSQFQPRRAPQLDGDVHVRIEPVPPRARGVVVWGESSLEDPSD